MEAYSSSLVRASTPLGDNFFTLFARYFFNREDVLAVSTNGNTPQPKYTTNFAPWIFAHLYGQMQNSPSRVRIGTYGPALDGSTRFLCFDFDGQGHAHPLSDPLAAVLSTQLAFSRVGLHSYLERSGSGKGWHLWVFFENPIPAKLARQLAFALLPNNILLASGKPADPRRGHGIEVFPKQDKSCGKGVGTLVWLPFWHHAPTGANLFYQHTEQGLAPYTPTSFDTVSLSQVERLVEQLSPKNPQVQISQKPTKTPKDSGLSPRKWEEWRREALQRLDLQDVYGQWLTGKQKSPDWLECRDPSSPTGDRKPSAGVATGNGKAEKGKFSSFISGESFSLFDFLVQHGGCSTLQDAYARVAQLSGVPLPSPKTKEAPSLPDRYRKQWEHAQQRELLLGTPLSLSQVEQALLQALHQADLDDLLTLLESPPGAGKTRAVTKYANHPLAGITALATHTHALNRELQQKAIDLSLLVRRLFSPTSKDGLLDGNGQRVCQIHYSIIQAEHDAGRSGPSVCAQCVFSKLCKARQGFEGSLGAQLVLCTQANPWTDGADRFIADEAPKLLVLREVSEADLEDCAKLCDSIHYTQRTLAKDAALKALQWIRAGAPQDQNPITELREKILAVIGGKDEVKPEGLFKPDSKERQAQAKRDAGAWRAARWLFALALAGAQPFLQQKRKGNVQERAATFAEKSPIALALSTLPRAVILDATASKHSVALLEKITGKKVKRVAFSVQDAATIERTWQPFASGARRYITKHGAPYFGDPLQQLFARSHKWIQKRKTIQKLLLVSHKPIAAALSLCWSDLTQQAPEISLTEYFRNLFPSEELASKYLIESMKYIRPCLDLLHQRGGILGVAWYGALRGLDQWKDFDACITLGDPFPDLDEFRRERALLRDGRAPTPDEEEADWQAYLEACAAELAQAHGRLRAPSREKAAHLLHLGGVLPKDWRPSQTQIDYQPVGRPKRVGDDLPWTWYGGVGRAVARAGSARALAAVVGLSPSAVLRYEKGERVPTPEAFGKISNYLNRLESASEIPIATEEPSDIAASPPPIPGPPEVPPGAVWGRESSIGISDAAREVPGNIGKSGKYEACGQVLQKESEAEEAREYPAGSGWLGSVEPEEGPFFKWNGAG